MIRRLPMFALFALTVLPFAANAQPRVVTAVPAADATVAKPTRIALTFAEPVAPEAAIELVMTSMPGMADHAPMPIRGFRTALSPDRRTLTATLPRALPAGRYDLSWRASDADGKATTGRYAFTVR
ncbi:copper resistance protein CopC [Sphingomonas sp. KR1UV-12]|uniref:Copper resistance protein CopC n=1 Tax=Sphingomonas aurea TaxID=3063994 RepID=A0ABT9EKV0_9SPHN|nr:copper resistance protein CopC [Sphingomonas sp. KR1UV-12]MDP1027581.1 copper resistance protein CopC [Sphingomonas sp. KR1UV-12]